MRILEGRNEQDRSFDVFETITVRGFKNPGKPVAPWMGTVVNADYDPEPGGEPDKDDGNDFFRKNPPFNNKRGGGG